MKYQRIHRNPIAALQVIAALLIAFAASSALAQSESYLIRNVRLFDGHQALDNMDVLTQGDRIIDVARGITTPPDATIIDGTGKTLIPGLIDSHTHSFERRQLIESLVFGVTTAVGLLDSPELVDELRTEGPSSDRADLFSSIHIAAPPGALEPLGASSPGLSSPAEAQAWVDARIAEGGVLTKIYLDDLSIILGPDNPIEKITPGALKALIKAAHRRDQAAVVHVAVMADALMAANKKADGLAHVPIDQLVTHHVTNKLLKRGTFVIDTLAIWQVADFALGEGPGVGPLFDQHLSPWLTSAARAQLVTEFPASWGDHYDYDVAAWNLRLLHEAGVPILAGSDARGWETAHGASLHYNLELMVLAGLSPGDALRSATSLPAEHLSFLGDRGTIEPGKIADLVLLNADPTTDITATRNIDAIWRLGTLIDRSATHAAAEALCQ